MTKTQQKPERSRPDRTGGFGKRIRIWLINLAGFLICIIAIAIAPLPGPGGTFMALTGLGVLAIVNPWASQLRQYLLDNHRALAGFLFPKNKVVILIWDNLAGFLAGFGIGLMLAENTTLITGALGSILMSLAGFVWLSNQDRSRRLGQHLFRTRKNRH